jgi:hypothetical protein
MQQTKYPFHESTLGMERQGIPSISKIVLHRRSQILADISAEQVKSVFEENKDREAERIRKVSRAISRPSFLYARVLGEILAATNRDTLAVSIVGGHSTASASFSPSPFIQSSSTRDEAAKRRGQPKRHHDNLHNVQETWSEPLQKKPRTTTPTVLVR